jgi:hypothetical protein
MKSTAFGTLLKEVIGGTPAEVGIKILLAAIVALWDNLQVIGPSVFLYFCALAVDAVMGAMVSTRKGKAFSTSHFMVGPMKKLGLTTGMMFVASIADSMIPHSSWIPDQPIFFGVLTFVGITTLLDVARKYGKLTGSKLIVWLEEKLGGYIKTKDEDVDVQPRDGEPS